MRRAVRFDHEGNHSLPAVRFNHVENHFPRLSLFRPSVPGRTANPPKASRLEGLSGVIGLAVLELARCGLDTDHRLRVPSLCNFCFASVRPQLRPTHFLCVLSSFFFLFFCLFVASHPASRFIPSHSCWSANASTSDERPFLTTQRPHGRCYHFRIVVGGRKCSRTSRDRGT